MKTKIFNLIILDESGSMSHVTNQTISGCNETINTIVAAQKKYASTQEHYVSIFVFQSNGNVPSRYLIKNVPACKVRHISPGDYQPWGATPLYDAVGATLTDLKIVTHGEELAVGSVTIITDGMENSSTGYTRVEVAKMIAALKELGWSFNFIGANIDVEAAAKSLNIDNSLEFKQDDEGTAEMFKRERSSRMDWLGRTNDVMTEMASPNACSSPRDKEYFAKKMKSAAKGYFRKDRGSAE